MRIFLFMPKAVKRQKVYGGLFTSLTEVLKDYPEVIITKENPDILHVFGCWNAEGADKIKSAFKKKIPTVLSPLGGLEPWCINNHSLLRQIEIAAYQKKEVTLATAIHVGGEMEKSHMNDISWNKNIFMVKNPVLTRSISKEELGHEMMNQYKEVISLHDRDVRIKIKMNVEATGEKDDNILLICRKLLYAKYQMERGNIPHVTIDDISSTFINSDYDENRMADRLNQLGIYQFTSSLEKVAADRSSLTEGFMPIMWTDNKLTKRINNLVTDYQ